MTENKKQQEKRKKKYKRNRERNEKQAKKKKERKKDRWWKGKQRERERERENLARQRSSRIGANVLPIRVFLVKPFTTTTTLATDLRVSFLSLDISLSRVCTNFSFLPSSHDQGDSCEYVLNI